MEQLLNSLTSLRYPRVQFPLDHERREFEFKEGKGKAVSSPLRISMRFISYIRHNKVSIFKETWGKYERNITQPRALQLGGVHKKRM